MPIFSFLILPLYFLFSYSLSFASDFPLSTEIQIGKLQHFLIDAPKGIYLTVGGERGFKAASMMPNITELWLVDISDEILKFNQINAELLKSPDRLKYLNLRWEANFETWQNQKLKLSQEDFNWWEQHIRDLDKLDYPLPEYLNKWNKTPPCPNNKAKLDLAKIIDYKHGNYLFNDKLYAKINQLALNNKIRLKKINLEKKEEVEILKAELTKNQLKISILDLNNLYFSGYIGEKNYLELVKSLLPYGESDAILIAMSNYKKIACAQFQFYLGFTFGQIKKWPPEFKMQYFIDSIPENIIDLIEGRLYREADILPYF